MTAPLTQTVAVEGQIIAPSPASPVEVELRPLAKRTEPGAPQVRRAQNQRRRWRGIVAFATLFGLPVVVSATYLFVIAAPRYASETSYIVRSASASGGGVGVSALMQSRGLSRAVDETYAVNEYLTSPEVVAKLRAENNLLEILARPEADVFNRYPGPLFRDNENNLRRRFETMLSQTLDEGTGISRMEVVAFRPEDAQSVATTLLKYAEEMVNRLNERAYRDTLATSNKFVDQAMAGLQDAEKTLGAYRDTSGSVDPSGDAAATMKVIQTLTVQLARDEASILEQAALAPHSPQSAALRERVSATRQEVDRLRLKVVGTGPSAASKIGKFEELALRRELAAKTLENAVASRDKARENAENQHLYVQVIRAPSLPDVARYPRGLFDLALVAAIALMVYFVLGGLSRAAREHRV